MTHRCDWYPECDCCEKVRKLTNDPLAGLETLSFDREKWDIQEIDKTVFVSKKVQ